MAETEPLELPILAIVRDLESYIGDPPKIGTHFPMEWQVDHWIRGRYPDLLREDPTKRQVFGVMANLVDRGLLERLPPGPYTVYPSPFHEFRTTSKGREFLGSYLLGDPPPKSDS